MQSIDQQGWLQSSVRTLGSYASTSTPAYTLSALFALSTPFGFASPAQAAAEAAAKVQHEKQVASLRNSASSQHSNGFVARLVAKVQAQQAAKVQTHAPFRVVPPFWQLAFFAAAFGTGGYMIDQGDVLNGSGVVSAWSLTYLLFKTLPSARQLGRNPLALGLSAAVVSIGLGVHGSHYFDRTSWRGAIPTLTSNHEVKAASEGRSRFVTLDKVGKTSSDDSPGSIFTSRASPSRVTATSNPEQRVTTPNVLQASDRNNDNARSAAFLHRQGRSQSGPTIP
ncbi:hypothetical protein PHSY_005230 [Pseudozyma hubeiensis SY62]|uniref:Uncharacterized protein n=1 Tax=Pseudozyma hubeiensis (strain SY62) TaxID=1305764 RepID=R9P8G8_PSEHS|nr:hypothetical protein PHSY_005230 [Pseudozyma hubeiensis SY62]GAC97644.1 hypothetical protein PHSY_005230 [Pseudozyma hubeiensis SY62]